MATLTQGLARPVQPVAATGPLSFKEKAKVWAITALKVSAAVILTVLAYGAFIVVGYGAFIGVMAGAYLASSNFKFAVESANLFVNDLIRAVGKGALTSMNNPFQLYQKIYEKLS